jgi:polyphenol oxidase
MSWRHAPVTRREFLLDTAATLGAGAVLASSARLAAQEPQFCAPPPSGKPPVPFQPNTGLAVLPRKSASALSATEIARLRDAYRALRELQTKDPSDPRGWMQQAHVHCWNCGGGLKDATAPDIHGSWLFLPWHRAYLYFHERILASLVGDPTFRLPYWDWDHAQRRRLPGAHATPENTSNSLFDRNRSAKATHTLPASLVGPAVMNSVLNATRFAAFGGDAAGSGTIEGAPHGGVHIWVGDRSLMTARADMGLLSTAAQDPLFFAHHGNIDRLWDVWVKSAKTHTNPTDNTWLQTRFMFYDENKQWTSIAIADVLNTEETLRYSFEADAGPSGTGAEARSTKLEIASSGAIRLPATLGAAGPSGTGFGPPSVSLLLEGLNLQALPAGIIGIFDNTGVSGAPTFQSPGYLGYVAIVPRHSSQQKHTHASARVTVDLSTQMKRLIGRPELKLVAAPLSAPPRARKPVELQVGAAELIEAG